MTLTEVLLGLIFLSICFGTLYIGAILGDILKTLCRQNKYILEWRQEMREGYACEDDWVDDFGDEWIDEWEGRL